MMMRIEGLVTKFNHGSVSIVFIDMMEDQMHDKETHSFRWQNGGFMRQVTCSKSCLNQRESKRLEGRELTYYTSLNLN